MTERPWNLSSNGADRLGNADDNTLASICGHVGRVIQTATA